MIQPRETRSQRFARRQNDAPTTSLVHLRSAAATDADLSGILDRLDQLYADTFEIVHAGEAAFFSDPILQHAATGILIQIGETAKHLPDSFTSSVDVPYIEMIKMRNRLAHALTDIDWPTVWSTVSLDIPDAALKQRRALVDGRSDTQQ